MVDSPHTTGVVPLLWAVDGRNMAATLYLVDSAGADVNAMSPISGTPLFAAINDYSYVDFLCSRGADVNAQNADGLTALHRAGTVSGGGRKGEKGGCVRRSDGYRPAFAGFGLCLVRLLLFVVAVCAALYGAVDVVRKLIEYVAVMG